MENGIWKGNSAIRNTKTELSKVRNLDNRTSTIELMKLEVRNFGNSSRDSEIRKFGNWSFRKLGNWEIGGFGHSEIRADIRRFGDSEIRKLKLSEIRKL